jgi:hypothetical protein
MWSRGLGVSVVCLVLGNAAMSSQADEPDAPAPHWKLTLGDYRYGGFSGSDFNLRWRGGESSLWVGVYSDRSFGTQSRAGFDTSVTLTDGVQLQPSVQVATGGFAGGSLNVQVGDAWFAFGGIGRTNLKPYFNLNFDPNDALTAGVGHRTQAGAVYQVFLVADDRLGTGQQDWHINARLPVQHSRLTLDLLYKRGMSDAGYVSAWGESATWDWPRYFLRVAHDPYQSFSADTAWRFSAGARF